MHAGTSDGDSRWSSDVGPCPACFQPREGAYPCACGYDPSGPVPLRPLKIGTVLDNGRFTIGRILGGGSFALVYLAREENDTLVAIKEYLPRDLSGRAADGPRVIPQTPRTGFPGFAEGLQAFQAEGTLLSRIRHPNVVEVHRRFSENDTAYIVMPWHPGWTLAERIAVTGPLLPTEAAQVGLRLLAALREMHEGRQPCVHRDVKPDNIYLCDDGTVLLLDFGAATEPGQGPAQPGFDHATPGYAPPEQWKTGKPENSAPAVDVYAWAATMHMALTGKDPPTVGDHDAPQERGAAAPVAIPPSKDSLSRLLWDCVRQGLSFTPAKRPTAATLHSRLRRPLERPTLSQLVSATGLLVVCFVLLAVLIEAKAWADREIQARHLAEQQPPIQQPKPEEPAPKQQPPIQQPKPEEPAPKQQPPIQQPKPEEPAPKQQPPIQQPKPEPATVTRTADVCGNLKIQYRVYTRPIRSDEAIIGVWDSRWRKNNGTDQGCAALIIQPLQNKGDYFVEYLYYKQGQFLHMPFTTQKFTRSELRFVEGKNYKNELGHTQTGGSSYSFYYQSDGSLSAAFTNTSGTQMKATFHLVPGSR